MAALLERIVALCLGDTAAPPWVAAEGKTSPRDIRPGVHSHKAWEVFMTLTGRLSFEAVSAPMTSVPERAILLVPPGLMHMEITRLPQPAAFEWCVMKFPQGETFQGAFRHFNGALLHGSIFPPLRLAGGQMAEPARRRPQGRRGAGRPGGGWR